MYHHDIPSQKSTFYVWEEKNISPFEELILSWNGYRPKKGYFHFSIALQKDEWTPHVDYVSWSSEAQKSFHSTNKEIESYQDIVTVKEGQAKGFRVRLEAKKGASLDSIFALHACTYQKKHHTYLTQNFDTVLPIEIPGLSQLALEHSRNRSFCSPTATTSVLRFLHSKDYHPVDFAKNVHDHAFDIYGNWVLNIAQASSYLGPDWRCWVARLNGMHDLIQQLQLGFPVVVSVKGTLPGSLVPYESGHLIAIRGYDSLTKQILCMDPAYPTNQETLVSYNLEDFLVAWEQRKCLAYIFQKN
jgi:predicted small secreted protein